MRILLACLALAACQAPAVNQADPTDQANESVVEAQMENSQDAVDDEIVNDADKEEAAEANAAN